MGRPGHVHGSPISQQGRPLILKQRAEGYLAGAIVRRAVARKRWIDHHWTANHVFAGGRHQCVQPLHIRYVALAIRLFGLRYHEDFPLTQDRCPDDSNYRRDIVVILVDIARRHRNHAGRINETGMPERIGIGAGIGIRVESIHGVVCRRDEHYIVHGSMDGLVRREQRLRVHLSVHRVGEQFPEGFGVYIGLSKDGLLIILPGSGIVVMVGQNRGDGLPQCKT